MLGCHCRNLESEKNEMSPSISKSRNLETVSRLRRKVHSKQRQMETEGLQGDKICAPDAWHGILEYVPAIDFYLPASSSINYLEQVNKHVDIQASEQLNFIECWLGWHK